MARAKYILVCALALLAGMACADPIADARQAVLLREYSRAIALLQAPAAADEAEACYQLGLLLERHRPAARSSIRRNLLCAAEQGDMRAQYLLAMLVEKEGDKLAAVSWYEVAANAGHTLARRKLDASAARPVVADPNLLLAAVKASDYAAVREQMAAGQDVNEPMANGMTAMQIALQQADRRMVQVLAGVGADLDQRDPMGDTALLHAVRKGDSLTVRLLVRLGASTELADAQGNTPLHIAAARDMPELADLLIGAPHGLEQENKQGETALEIAQRRENLLFAELLLKQARARRWLLSHQWLAKTPPTRVGLTCTWRHGAGRWSCSRACYNMNGLSIDSTLRAGRPYRGLPRRDSWRRRDCCCNTAPVRT